MTTGDLAITDDLSVIGPGAGNLTDLIGAIPLFTALTVEQRARLLERGKEQAFAAGQIIIRQDDPAATAYVILSGRVRDASYVGAIVTTLTWRSKGALCARSVLILPDMLPAEDFRRLRVLLRYGRSDDTAGAPASQA